MKKMEEAWFALIGCGALTVVAACTIGAPSTLVVMVLASTLAGVFIGMAIPWRGGQP
jgi:hypothetical protein